MGTPVSDGARLTCSSGVGEVKLVVCKRGVSHGSDGSLATLEDCVPLVNIPPFRSCMAATNPHPCNPSGQKPCTPRFAAQWSDEVDGISLQGKKLVEQRATLMCDYAGTVRIKDSSQQDVSIRDDLLRNPVALSST
jgi:hypothetical protein